MYTYVPLSLLLLPALPALAAPPLGVRAPSSAQQLSSRSPTPEPYRMPLKAHRTRQFSSDLSDRQNWLKAQAANAKTKYRQHLSPEARDKHDEDLARRKMEKRATGSVTLTDSGIDASYSGQVAIG
ncbi:hypothetical protein BD324DRAFT_323189 [Kockovaella imperatae]|uniref:Uncharacterized protein n=1 Tax=Kockovaella imperatae TaxID=4999 RepID=A0A1Y1UML1_9TREE|nr:hypothetical protein BD324DRAFT_323189 [Kockovaella imperatae]ORX39291.1 hypothetical protein BD324DRAFT_323189 [Kockovaella imperatae]